MLIPSEPTPPKRSATKAVSVAISLPASVTPLPEVGSGLLAGGRIVPYDKLTLNQILGRINMKCAACGYENANGVSVCNSCGKVLVAAVSKPEAFAAGAKDKFALDKYLLRQKAFSLLGQKYYISDEKGQPLFYVERQLHFVRGGDVLVYDDDKKTTLVLRVVKEGVLDAFSRFRVEDAQGRMLGSAQRHGLVSLLFRTWTLCDASGHAVGRVQEDSLAKALFRRFGPFGEFLKTDFHFYVNEVLVAKLIRRWTVLDRYVLDLTANQQHLLDPRLALGIAVLLDTAEKR